jgi:CBS domain-containing protein
MIRKLPVKDIMTKKPIVVKGSSTVKEAANVMKKNSVGSLIVTRKEKPIGIITERDILLKVIAGNKTPAKTKIKDIMTSPVVTISPNTDVTDAARKMAKLNIRRLPVVQKDELQGVVTENDILRIAPALIELTREHDSIDSGEARPKRQQGYCEICMEYTEELVGSEGALICPSCAKGR